MDFWSEGGVSQGGGVYGEAAGGVDFFDDVEGADAFGEAGGRGAVEADIVEESTGFEGPGVVAAHVFPRGDFGRAHLGEHFVVGEFFGAVGTAEAVEGEFGVAAVDFEGEEVFPLGAGDVEEGGLPGGGAEVEEGVIIDLHVPKIGGGVAFDGGEIAEEPAGEVDEVDALVDELAAAGEGGIGAPFAVVAAAAAVAVAGAHEHEGAEHALVEEGAGFLQGRVVAVVVAEADFGAGGGGDGGDVAELGGVEGAGFLDEHVFTGGDGGEGDGGEGGVEGGDDDGVEGGIGEGDVEIGERGAAGDEGGEVGGAAGVEVAGVAHGDEVADGEDAFTADEAAADDGEAEGRLGLVSHGEGSVCCGIMAKQAHYPRSGARSWIEDAGLVLIAAGVIWFFMWTVRPLENGAPWWDERGDGYYNLQLRGFLKGQLNLDREVEPAMLVLADPWDPGQRAGLGMHDASYYDGKYHMYFGVTPVLVLFAPFYGLSGGKFLGEHTAAVVFGAVGVLVALGLLRAIRWRHFPEASVGWMWAAALTATMMTMVPVLMRRASIWEVPIMGAQALSMLFLALYYRHWMTRRWG